MAASIMRAQHITRLRRRRRLTGQDVDAIDAHHRQHAIACPVANAYSVFLARRAYHPLPRVPRVHRKRAAIRTRDHVDAAHGGDGAPRAERECYGQCDRRGVTSRRRNRMRYGTSRGLRGLRVNCHDRLRELWRPSHGCRHGITNGRRPRAGLTRRRNLGQGGAELAGNPCVP